MENGKTFLGVVNAEEALLAAPLTSDVVVIGEKHTGVFTEPLEAENMHSCDVLVSNDDTTQTVVIVKSDYSGGLSALKGKKYCHPGFKYEEILTPLLLQQFENEVLDKTNSDICANNGTLVERYIKALSEFFGDSCRPGMWTVDEDLNNQLRMYY